MKNEETQTEQLTPRYYARQFRGHLFDPYRVLRIFDIQDPAIQHAIKKLLRLGGDAKPAKQDVEEAIVSLKRYLQMLQEDESWEKQKTE